MRALFERGLTRGNCTVDIAQIWTSISHTTSGLGHLRGRFWGLVNVRFNFKRMERIS